MTSTWTCAQCGETHSGLAFSFGGTPPLSWQIATDAEREDGELTPDFCTVVVDGQRSFFVRGNIEIPVLDGDEPTFQWTVWVSLSEESMSTTFDHWDDPARAELPLMFGWLNTHLPYAETTVALPTRVHTREPGWVPLIEIDHEVEHELAREQRDGITVHRVEQLNRVVMGDPETAKSRRRWFARRAR